MTEKKNTSNLVVLKPAACYQGKSIKVDPRIATTVEWFAKRFGVWAYSGYRTKAENESTGGAPSSDHLCGAAVDFVGPYLKVKIAHVYAIAQQKRGKVAFVEMTWTAANKHLHISYFRCK